MAERIELTIDGRAVAVEPGTTILEAARRAGIDIPVLCYSKRTTPNGAFWGLILGTGATAVHYGLTGVAGGRMALLHVYPSDMAQNFWGAIVAWTSCFVLTIAISLFTRPRDEKELVGLVYSLTPKQTEEGLAWYRRPAVLGVIVLAMTVALNVYFW